jgi:formyl-CoA transferase
MGGIRYVTGDPDKPPSRAGISLGDELAGTFAALGTLVALHARQRTGRGQIVDAALYEAVLAMMESLLPEWEVAGYQRERTGSVLPNVAPSNAYPTLDGPVLIAANQDSVFRRLAAVMGQPELAYDERYATHGGRGANAEELDQLIATWSAKQPAASLLAELHENGIPAGLIYRAADMLTDPHFAARNAIMRLLHPEFGEIPMQNVVPQLSETPGAVRSLGPTLGEHNAEVYRGLLKLTRAQTLELANAGVI